MLLPSFFLSGLSVCVLSPSVSVCEDSSCIAFVLVFLFLSVSVFHIYCTSFLSFSLLVIVFVFLHEYYLVLCLSVCVWIAVTVRLSIPFFSLSFCFFLYLMSLIFFSHELSYFPRLAPSCTGHLPPSYPPFSPFPLLAPLSTFSFLSLLSYPCLLLTFFLLRPGGCVWRVHHGVSQNYRVDGEMAYLLP